MQKPAGLKLRNGIWHADKIVRIGTVRKPIRRSTGCREDEVKQAIIVLERWIAETKEEIINGPTQHEHTYREAAVQYILSLERRGKDPARAIQDINMTDAHIGDLPLSHVHQGTLEPFERAQRGLRRSSTIARSYRTTVAVLNHAARVLRDGNRPWLTHAVPKIQAPDWGDRLPPHHLDWPDQDRLLAQLDKPTSRHLIAPVLFGLATGAREQEICSIKWTQEIDAEGMPRGSVWWIPPEIRKGNAKRPPSQQQGRYLIANATARSVIDRQRDNGSALVFPGPNRQQILRINNTAWRSAWAKAGLPTTGTKRGVHNLRHTYGARLEAAGVPWDYRKALLGHEIHDVTALYSAPGLARLLEQAEKVQRATAPTLRPVTQFTHGS